MKKSISERIFTLWIRNYGKLKRLRNSTYKFLLFLCKKVKTISRQNKKGALEEFLFGLQLNQSTYGSSFQENFEEKIQI